jgi:hypothetical protein
VLSVEIVRTLLNVPTGLAAYLSLFPVFSSRALCTKDRITRQYEVPKIRIPEKKHIVCGMLLNLQLVRIDRTSTGACVRGNAFCSRMLNLEACVAVGW